MCQAPRVSNRPQWSACDKGSCTEEPDEVESLTSGSEPGVKEGIPLPTVTSGRGCRGFFKRHFSFAIVSEVDGYIVSAATPLSSHPLARRRLFMRKRSRLHPLVRQHFDLEIP
jgi:hypothetical protein